MPNYTLFLGWVFAIVAALNVGAAIWTGLQSRPISLLFTLNFFMLGYVIEVLL